MAETETKRPFFMAGRKRRKVITIAGCLLVATVFWFFNALNNDYSAIIKYPVKIEFDASDFSLKSGSDKYVQLSASGYGWYLLYYSLGIGTKPLSLSLQQFVDNKYVPDAKLLEIAKVQLQNIEIQRVVSDTFKVEILPKTKKKFYLRLETKKLHLPKGKRLTDLEISPNYITCNGPKNELIILPDSINFSILDTLIEKDFNKEVPIFYRPSKNIRQNIVSVKVKFKLE